MAFACGQAIECARDFLPGQPRSILNHHSFQHRSESGAARQSRRTAVSQKACGFDALIPHTQGKTQAIAADGIRLFRDGRGIR